MNSLPLPCLLLLAFSFPTFAQDQVSGLVLPRSGGGMTLRNSDGEFEIEWHNKTAVALDVNTRQLKQLATDRDGKATPAEVARQALSPLEHEALYDPKVISEAAGSVIEKFLNAPSWKARLAFVCLPDKVAPLMQSYYEQNPQADAAIGFRAPRDGWKLTPHKNFALSAVELEDFRSIPIGLERQPDGSYLVDWESFVGYCEVPWVEIPKQRPTKPFLIRARAAIGDYYNFGYNDDQWACLRLEDYDGEHVLYGYVELDSPILSELKEVLTSKGRAYVTLKVKFPNRGKAKNQVLITGDITRGWVTRVEQTTAGKPFRYQVPSSKQEVECLLPAGEITAVVPVVRPDEALKNANGSRWIPERGLRLFFNETRSAQLPTREAPRFVGRWESATTPRKLDIDGNKYELSLKKGGQSNALLFNVLTTADCKPFVNRATVIGRKQGNIIHADEIHLTPIGDQAALDDPALPRYLFIGDSISGNYSKGLREQLKGKLNLHHPPTNCGPSAKGKAEIVEWLGAYDQPGRGWDVISFNFGHWDSGRDKANYQKNLEAVIAELKKTGAKLVWITTCPVPSGNEAASDLDEDGNAPGRKAGVMEKYLNPWAAEVIAKHPEISTCDQWQFVKDDPDGLFKEWWTGTDVHFRGEMAAALGKFLADHIITLARDL